MELAQILARIERRLEAVGLTASAASKQAGKPDAIRNIQRAVESDDRKGVSTATLNALAPVLRTTAVWLLAEAGPEDPGVDGPEGGPRAATEVVAALERVAEGRVASVEATYGGVVEAGSFRAVEDFDDMEHTAERPTLREMPDRDYPGLPITFFDVNGDSMNALQPRPILPGDKVVAIAFAEFRGNLALRDGMVVVVEQTLDGGHHRERSVKQVELYDDRVEYHPRSTSKRHKPIIVPRSVFTDPSEGDGREVNVLAIVRRIVNDVPIS